MTRWLDDGGRDGADYDAAFRRLEAEGTYLHGEADLVASYAPASVLDGGCGTGRVAIELARRGIDVVGVDSDERMLAAAREKAPQLPWVAADLASVDLARAFDVVVLAGNVMIFVAPGTEPAVVANCARHLVEGGRLVAGFDLREDRVSLEAYDAMCADAGLDLESRWATWEREPYDGGEYAVSVHRRR